MKPPAPKPGLGEPGSIAGTSIAGTSIERLRELTPARVGLGRTGASLPTDALLAFTLDHARARDAVHAAFDTAHLATGLTGLGLDVVAVASQARSRADYLRRPDLGRMLDSNSPRALGGRGGGPGRPAPPRRAGRAPAP